MHKIGEYCYLEKFKNDGCLMDGYLENIYRCENLGEG
jgi:hypothetical protein